MLAKNLAKDEIIRALLTVVAAPIVVPLLAIVPKTLKALPELDGVSLKYNRRHYIRSLIRRMAGRGWIKLVTNRQGVSVARLTTQGRKQLQKYQFRKIRIPKPNRWDGKYRLIMFDIKEWKRGTRNELRYWLEHLGFLRLQNSVWVYPHDCREIIALLKAHFKIGREVLYVIAEEVENDRWLQREFKNAGVI